MVFLILCFPCNLRLDVLMLYISVFIFICIVFFFKNAPLSTSFSIEKGINFAFTLCSFSQVLITLSSASYIKKSSAVWFLVILNFEATY